LRAGLRDELRRCPDLERTLSRLTVGRGGPRDLAAVRDALQLAGSIARRIADGARSGGLDGEPDLIEGAVTAISDPGSIFEPVAAALAADLPLQARDGGFIATGYSSELDELKTLRDRSRRLIADLQARYAAETGVASLKVRHNNVLGYFVEISSNNAAKLQSDDRFIHRQTLAGSMRFGTVELGELESRIATAADKALGLELALFDQLVAGVVA